MKSLKELEEIRKKTLETINIRKDRTGTRVVVGMATCGIAAGARPVLMSIMDEVKKNNLADVVVAQTGCIGMCRFEPIVEVYKPGEEKVTYVKVTAAKALRIMNEHVMQGKVVDEYTIGAEEK
ncbi:MAG: (2Fe-2S) ferredoxin protein [Clostridia bacterium]|jgi:NADP-reducing hydrogenase subunit HndB|nr:(2Fe-2S) ferredoxin protein [Clostridia bacterium]